MTEFGVQSCDYTEGREDRNICPVDLLKLRMAVEAVVDARNGRPPHQDHDAEVVQLVAGFLHFWAVVTDDMVGC